jgi:hypothetical protein
MINLLNRGGAISLFMLVLFLSTGSSLFCQPVNADPWKGFGFLIGEWAGEGNGQPGKGSGSFTISIDLEKQILVRKNHSEYPAAQDHPAFIHDDLLICYHENNAVRGIYFDSEGHVIHYSISFSPDSDSVILASDVIEGAPRFRFTYTKTEPGKLKVSFDIAPPGNPEKFANYLVGIVVKKGK